MKEGKGRKRQSRRDGARERPRIAPGSDPVTGRLEPFPRLGTTRRSGFRGTF